MILAWQVPDWGQVRDMLGTVYGTVWGQVRDRLVTRWGRFRGQVPGQVRRLCEVCLWIFLLVRSGVR